VAGNNDDAVFLAGKLGDYVVAGEVAFGTLDAEGVVFDLNVLQRERR